LQHTPAPAAAAPPPAAREEAREGVRLASKSPPAAATPATKKKVDTKASAAGRKADLRRIMKGIGLSAHFKHAVPSAKQRHRRRRQGKGGSISLRLLRSAFPDIPPVAFKSIRGLRPSMDEGEPADGGGLASKQASEDADHVSVNPLRPEVPGPHPNGPGGQGNSPKGGLANFGVNTVGTHVERAPKAKDPPVASGHPVGTQVRRWEPTLEEKQKMRKTGLLRYKLKRLARNSKKGIDWKWSLVQRGRRRPAPQPQPQPQLEGIKRPWWYSANPSPVVRQLTNEEIQEIREQAQRQRKRALMIKAKGLIDKPR